MNLRADWNRVYHDRFRAIRDRYKRERGEGLNRLNDAKLDARAWRDAEGQVQEAINRWRERHGIEAPELRDL